MFFGVIGYTAVFVAVGEFFGWFDNLKPKHKYHPESVIQRVELEDFRAKRGIFDKQHVNLSLPTSSARKTQIREEAFVFHNLETGVDLGNLDKVNHYTLGFLGGQREVTFLFLSGQVWHSAYRKLWVYQKATKLNSRGCSILKPVVHGCQEITRDCHVNVKKPFSAICA